MDRYARQKLIPGLDQKVISSANILVVGAGTIGNEVIKNLVLLGFKKITIIDNDTVAEVNLSRSVLFRDTDLEKPKAEVAAQRAYELHPNQNVQITGLNQNIISSVGCFEYSKFSCVILAVDSQEARMWVNRYCYLTSTPLIDTGTAGQGGRVIVLFNTRSSPCLECGWPESVYELLQERYGCLKEGVFWAESPIPMVITSASIVGGIAVQECVRLLHFLKQEQSVEELFIRKYDGLTLSYNGEDNYFAKWRQTFNPQCRCKHMQLGDLNILPIKALPHELVKQIKLRIQEYLKVEYIDLHYDKELVYSVSCRNCGYMQSVNPTWLGEFRRSVCPKCHEFTLLSRRVVTMLEDDYTLDELSVPPNHLLQVDYSTQDGLEDLAYIIIEGRV